MKKRTKALWAGLAGTALLAGGGTTYALWGAETTFGNADAIVTGDLRLTLTETVSWAIRRAGTEHLEALPGGLVELDVAEGDELVASAAVSATLLGATLVAKLTHDGVAGHADYFGTPQVIVGDETFTGRPEDGETVPITVVFTVPTGLGGAGSDALDLQLGYLDLHLIQDVDEGAFTGFDLAGGGS